MTGFGENSYDLGICQLRHPTKDEAQYLGLELSKIEPWKTLNSSPEGLMEGFLFRDSSTHTYAVYHEEIAVGIISVRYPWLVGPYLGFLGLVPKSQGLGIGKALMAWLEETAKVHSSRNIYICVSEFNPEAYDFYKKCGYNKVANLEGLIVDEYAEFLLRKRLP